MNKEDIKNKLLKGELVILEEKNGDKIEQVEYNTQEFIDFISHQENIAVMSDCITLLEGNQVHVSGVLYKLIYGKKLVIDTFEKYANYFIDAINESIDGDVFW